MPSNTEALEFIKTNETKWVDLQFVGINGELKRRTVASKDIVHDTFTNGVQTDLDEIYGFGGKTLALVPDSDTYARIPWEQSTMRMLCDVKGVGEKEQFAKDPRNSIEKAGAAARSMGFGDVLLGTDVEFYIFDNVASDRTSPERGMNFLIESREASWNPNPMWGAKSGAYDSQPYDTLYGARTQICEMMEDAFRYGIASHTHGRSSSGQQRVKVREYNAKVAADALTTLKYVARNISFIGNGVTTFMPLPMMNGLGSTLNLSQVVKKSGANVFYDSKDEFAQLSQTGLYYIGGILEHAEALSAFTNPTTNSYKRLKRDPRYIAWSRDNPNALAYVPKADAEDGRNVVFTGSDASVNPYLAYAAVVAAGLDGIKSKKDPGKAVTENLGEMSGSRMRELKIKQLPSDIMESIAALESDNKFLKGFVSPDLLADYLDQKLLEHNENEKWPTAYELDRYFNC